jgi:tRNA/rRNA methyltransferase
MKNMGLRRLLLVGDAPLPGAEDRALAYGAWDVLDAAERYPSLEQAVAGSTFVAGASGRGGDESWTPRRLAEEGAARAGEGRTSLVFGPESTGLTREELRLCHVVVRIPSDAGHSSLNLAQAVLVLAYEIRVAGSPGPARGLADQAPAGDLEECLAALREGLLGIGYLNPEDPGRILGEIRGLLARAGATRRELTLLRGMARQMAWAGSVASRARGSG